ncbi:MAG TPA: hypothetical protein VIN03_25000 [Roseateles sp.]
MSNANCHDREIKVDSSKDEASRNRHSGLLQSLSSSAIGLFTLGAFVYAVRTRTMEDFLRYPWFIAAPIAAIALAILISEWAKKGFTRPARSQLLAIFVGAPIGIAFAGVVYYCLGVAIKDAFYWFVSPTSGRPQMIVLTAIVTLGFGAALFFFRLRYKSTYGFSEAMVGVVVAVHRVTTDTSATVLSNASVYLAVLTAGIYLVVRGFDNIHQGLTKDPKDPIASLVLKRVLSALRDPESPQPAGNDAG